MKKSLKTLSRRGLLQTGAGLALGGLLRPSETVHAAEKSAKPSVYELLGLRHIINCQGSVTILGGSTMPPEAVAAWVDASKHFVNVPQLLEKVGDRIAALIGVEAACVTTGAAGSIFLGTAAAITRGDSKAVQQLPDTTGLRHEVIIQKSHHGYDQQLTGPGGKFVRVESVEDVEKAVNEKTALMFFMNYLDDAGKIKRQEWAELGKRLKVPTLIDAAADVPPRERLTSYVKMGYDMVAFSGGKAMRGPNNTGLLLGNRELILAARKNESPNASIGRMLKVSKEDAIALLYAVEKFVKTDEQAETNMFLQRIAGISDSIKDIPSIKTSTFKPPIANNVPHLRVEWDAKQVKITGGELAKQLMDGDQPIQTGGAGGRRGGGRNSIELSVLTLEDNEVPIVASRLKEILSKAVS